MIYSTDKKQNVEIVIKERSGSRQIRVPWLPEEVEYGGGNTIRATYDILDRGPVDVPTGEDLATISWSSIFPGGLRTDENLLHGQWYHPRYYHKIIIDWKNNGTPLNVMLTGYPININVVLDKYSAKASGPFGDWEYKISFIEDREVVVKSSTVKRQTKKTITYTLKKGDTLWKIAQKYLGAGSKWKTIYNANKTIIEQQAKKHGKKSSNNGSYLYAGVKITIPQ